MSLGDSQFVQLRQTLRPARVAVATDHSDAYWLHSVVRLTEQLAMTWGGATALIVPVGADGSVHERIWEVVRVYDADIWASYEDSWRALLLADPDEFERQLDAITDRRVTEHGGDRVAERASLREALLAHSGGGVDPLSPALLERLAAWSGVSTGVDGRVDVEYLASDMDVGQRRHLTPVAALDPLPPRVTTLDLTLLPRPLATAVTSIVGALDEPDIDLLRQRGLIVDSFKVRPDEIEVVLAHAWNATKLSRRTLSDADTGVEIEARELFGELPYSLARLGCAGMKRFAKDAEVYPTTVVVGDTIDDFAYAHALMRCTGRAMWLPTSALVGDLGHAIVRELTHTLRGAVRSNLGDRPLMLCSLSEPDAELESLVDSIHASDPWPDQLVIELGEPDPPRQRILSLLDRRHYDVQLEELIAGSEMQRGVPLLVPSAVDSVDTSVLKWWIDVRHPRRVLPPRSALNRSVAPAGTGTFPYEVVRSADGAAAFASHTMGLVLAGARREDALVRPRLRFPDAHEVFKVLFERSGIEVETSDKGRFQTRTLELWGGLKELAEDLTDQRRAQLMLAWTVTSTDGSAPGVFTRERRFLTFDDCVEASGLDADGTRAVLDHFLSAGIARRGHLLRCDRCRYLCWYPLDDVGRSFRCGRCDSVGAPSTAGVPSSSRELTVAYDLNEVVYQFLMHNGRVPVVALHRLSESAGSFMFAPEMRLKDASNGKEMELDLVAVADGRILVGEAKVNDRLENSNGKERRRLERILRAAEHVTADRIVLATAVAWRDETKRLVDDVLGTSPFEVELLEGLDVDVVA